MRLPVAAVLSNRNIPPASNASSQTQDRNCVFVRGPDYGKGNRRVCKKKRAD